MSPQYIPSFLKLQLKHVSLSKANRVNKFSTKSARSCTGSLGVWSVVVISIVRNTVFNAFWETVPKLMADGRAPGSPATPRLAAWQSSHHRDPAVYSRLRAPQAAMVLRPRRAEKPCRTHGTNRKMFPDEGGFAPGLVLWLRFRFPDVAWLCPRGPGQGGSCQRLPLG